MSAPVRLYVYDLSNGMAKQLSRQLTGRQIDGIWHTSVVVFRKEVFYGQGIDITAPGRSHHGSPLQIIDMGETSLDEETFDEYLTEMREHYTADKYHLLEFNCNSFTNDCIGFLTGGSIPDFIKDLPTDFLSTPFGAALRPTIDAMYRRPTPGSTPPPNTAVTASPNPPLAASLLQSVAAQARSPPSSGSSSTGSQPLSATESLTAPIHLSTNPASFQSLLRTHRAVVAFFTSSTCPPCRMIEPVFERLAEEKGAKLGGGGSVAGAAFTKVDLDVGRGGSVAEEWGVRVTPTFIFFLDGEKIHELKGADANELRSQVDLLIFQAYPPHPHTSLSLPGIESLSLNPILFTQVPALDTVLNKITSFIDSAPWPASSVPSKYEIKQTFTTTIVPYLKARFAIPNTDATTNGKVTLPSANPTMLETWTQATATLTSTLPVESLFPLVDMWRLAFLDPAVGAWSVASSSSNQFDPIAVLLAKATAALQNSITSNPRNFILTVLRLLSNAFSNPTLGWRLLDTSSRRNVTALLVPTLLHEDAAVRTAAASLAFNMAALLQNGRVERVRNRASGGADGEDEDWEVEMVSAVVEAIDREKGSEEVVHRLTASLAFLLRLSPFYETQLALLLEVLQGRAVLKSKLGKGGCGTTGVSKKEVRRLVEEVAGKLCP